MISLLNYNFFGDGNALDPMLTATGNLYPRVANGVIDQLNITHDVEDDSEAQPTAWTVDTVINALFDGSLSAGNISEIAADITGVRVKRRKLGTFDWVTLYDKTITDTAELSFVINDNIAESGVDYEYAFVPIVNGTEGAYSIQTILSSFRGVFLSDADSIFRLDADVSYGTNSAVTKRGIYEPYGRQYPVIISNGVNNYETGSVSGLVLPDDYDPTNPIPRKAIVEQRKLFIDFLNNRKPKLLRDWNGNILIVSVTDNPTTTYLTGSGMGLVNVTASWAQTGDADSKQDLYDNGLIPTTN